MYGANGYLFGSKGGASAVIYETDVQQITGVVGAAVPAAFTGISLGTGTPFYNAVNQPGKLTQYRFVAVMASTLGGTYEIRFVTIAGNFTFPPFVLPAGLVPTLVTLDSANMINLTTTNSIQMEIRKSIGVTPDATSIGQWAIFHVEV